MTQKTQPAANPPEPSDDARFPDPVSLRLIDACDAIGDVIEYWGFKRVQGRVWTYVALSREPRAQIEIAEALQISKSLVSLTISELAEFNLVRPISDRRGAPYEATLDIWPVVSDVLRSREWMLLETARLALSSLREEIEISGDDADDLNLEHAKLLLNMTELAQAMLKTVMSIRNPEPPQVTQSWMKRASSILTSFRKRSRAS